MNEFSYYTEEYTIRLTKNIKDSPARTVSHSDIIVQLSKDYYNHITAFLKEKELI